MEMYSCANNAGKCDRSWMEGYCLESCGLCEGDSESEAEDKEPAEKEPVIASTPLPSADCVDVLPPDSDFTCEEQAEYGKCDAGRFFFCDKDYLCGQECLRVVHFGCKYTF